MRHLDSLELRIHPPVLLMIFALPTLFGEWSYWLHPLSMVLVIVAGVLGLTALINFLIAGTTYKPHRPELTQSLVTSGVYRWSRNPMYLSLVLLLTALYLASCAWWGVFLVPLFVLWLQHFQIRVEERILQQRFGAEYQDYCRRVRRWC